MNVLSIASVATIVGVMNTVVLAVAIVVKCTVGEEDGAAVPKCTMTMGTMVTPKTTTTIIMIATTIDVAAGITIEEAAAGG